MRLLYQLRSGKMIYGFAYELDGKVVIERELLHAFDEPQGWRKPIKHSFETEALAAKYLRHRVSNMGEHHELVEGEAPTLDPRESFRDVKDKGPAYRYFEHPAQRRFIDVDLDVTRMIVVEGPIDEPGVETVTDFHWGEASEGYAAKLKQILAAGYLLVEGSFKAKDLEKIYGVKFPKPLRDFYDKKEIEHYRNATVSGLPTYENNRRFTVDFEDPSLDAKLAASNFRDEERPGFAPLSGLISPGAGDPENGMLLVQTKKPTCPIYLFMYADTEMHLVSPSLEAFLKSLQPGGSAPAKAKTSRNRARKG